MGHQLIYLGSFCWFFKMCSLMSFFSFSLLILLIVIYDLYLYIQILSLMAMSRVHLTRGRYLFSRKCTCIRCFIYSYATFYSRQHLSLLCKKVFIGKCPFIMIVQLLHASVFIFKYIEVEKTRLFNIPVNSLSK